MRTQLLPGMNSLKISKGILFFAAAIVACLSPRLAIGQTNSSWNGGTGNWSTSADWTPNGVPNNGGGNTYNVTIDSGGTDAVILNQNATIVSLTLGGSTGTSSLSEASGAPETLTVMGGVTVNQTGFLDLESGSTITVSGNLTNSGTVDTNHYVYSLATNTLNVTGTFTNQAGAQLNVDVDSEGGDVINIGSLINDGFIFIGSGSVLNLTNQPNGITDIVAGSSISVAGILNAGSNNGFANLSSIEGAFGLSNSETTVITPGSGTLLVSGNLGLDGYATLVVKGNLANSGQVTMAYGDAAYLTVTGTFTNQPNAQLIVSSVSGMTGVANIGTLINYGYVYIGLAGSVNLTNQPNGITDIVAGSTLDVAGLLNVGTSGGLTNSGLANLGSINGNSGLWNSHSEQKWCSGLGIQLHARCEWEFE